MSSIDSLTNFQKNAKSFVGRLEESKEPIVLTVNGRAKLVIQDADAYQVLLDELDRARFLSAVQQGIREADQGLSLPASEVFAEMKDRYGL